jgi:hypothetical protein
VGHTSLTGVNVRCVFASLRRFTSNSELRAVVEFPYRRNATELGILRVARRATTLDASEIIIARQDSMDVSYR